MKLKVKLGIILGIALVMSLVIFLGDAISRDPVTGVVERVGTVADARNVSIKLKGNSTLYTCDERCYAILEGDEVTLHFAPLSGTQITGATINQTTPEGEAR